jgi:hypothetical protein
MLHLIYDEDGELLEVLDFKTPTEIKAYKHLNPSHVVELADPILEESLLSDIDEDLDDPDADIIEEEETTLW